MWFKCCIYAAACMVNLDRRIARGKAWPFLLYLQREREQKERQCLLVLLFSQTDPAADVWGRNRACWFTFNLNVVTCRSCSLLLFIYLVYFHFLLLCSCPVLFIVGIKCVDACVAPGACGTKLGASAILPSAQVSRDFGGGPR